MRSLMSLVGILLIIFGIVAFGYQGFTYTQHQKIAELGDIQVTADKEKFVYLSPVAGGAALITGVVLLALSRRK